MTKMSKIVQLKKFKFFLLKNAIFLFLAHDEELSSYREVFSPPPPKKKEHPAFQNKKFLNFFLFLSLFAIRIRIQRPNWVRILSGYVFLPDSFVWVPWWRGWGVGGGGVGSREKWCSGFVRISMSVFWIEGGARQHIWALWMWTIRAKTKKIA